jgi:hypothetical protein
MQSREGRMSEKVSMRRQLLRYQSHLLLIRPVALSTSNVLLT